MTFSGVYTSCQNSILEWVYYGILPKTFLSVSPIRTLSCHPSSPSAVEHNPSPDTPHHAAVPSKRPLCLGVRLEWLKKQTGGSQNHGAHEGRDCPFYGCTLDVHEQKISSSSALTESKELDVSMGLANTLATVRFMDIQFRLCS